ncbi:hypothetical protein SVAN01_01232 [Stagonosporopsis vannaccii]|nr:hypothetical protein SVAN01_01232 [Stagonosporopsis vannaccii]
MKARCQLVTHPSSEERLQLYDLHSSASPTAGGVTTLRRIPDIGGENEVDRLRRDALEQAARAKAELLVPITSIVSRITPNEMVREPTQEQRCTTTYFECRDLELRTWLGGGMSKQRHDNVRGFKSQLQVSSSGTQNGAYPATGKAPAEPSLSIPAPIALQSRYAVSCLS